ncbi:IRSp53/MIM-like domain-containing protein [Rhodotorula toruloides]|uniref:IRSp53/MIM-like domain-containing protein n=1 Tax=Rhodotorula toruloides TaxID=5286 RepID=A0A511KHR4_RHOTO|nr:IRSp53/MIM-like domain-containing protein [Rhodotorula toruloides]
MPASLRPFRGSSRPPNSYKDSQLSPTLSTTTVASRLNLGEEGPKTIVTRADLRESVAAYGGLLSSAKAYRNALIAMSAASTNLAGALGECARVQGAEDSGEGLMAASGLHYMVANSGQVLSDTLYRSVELPLLTAYDSYVADIAARHAEYEDLLKEKTAKIRETEAENMRQGRKKTRDLNQFRRALAKLTEQVAEVEVCKRSYYSEVLQNETEMWGMISNKVSLLVRSTLDLADRLASKATSDPVIESMLNEHPDPFDSFRLDRDETRDVFTILPPMNLGAGPSAASSEVLSDGASTRSMDEHETARPMTPKQLAKAPMSVSQVLGLDQLAEDHRTPRAKGTERPAPDNDLEERSEGRAASTSPLHSRKPSMEQPNSAVPSTSSSTPSPALLAADSAALDHSVDSLTSASSNPFDRPSLTTEAAPFSTLSTSARTEQSSPRKNGRRRLSRVTEAQDPPADPMAGDWGAPVYGRSLSPGMNGGSGYESGEEDAAAWTG